MFPPTSPTRGDRPLGPSYSGVFVAADRDRVLTELEELRFTGYLGPQEGRWVLIVSGNPLGKVAAKKRRFSDVARDLAITLGTLTLAAQVERDSRLRLVAFDSEEGLPSYDSDPVDDEHGGGGITLDDFGNPIVGAGAFVDNEVVAASLLSTFEVQDAVEVPLAELLDEDLGEDVSESERLVGVLRILGLPTWLVSSDSLPRRVPGGPGKDQVTWLGAGKQGVSGMVADVLTKPVRPKPKADL